MSSSSSSSSATVASTTSTTTASASETKTVSKVALITGANKGIGLAVVESLVTKKFKGSPLTVLLAARDKTRGEEAVAAVKKAGHANVEFLLLDVDSPSSIKDAAAAVKKQYGGLDILINNAGIAWKGDAFDGKVAAGTFATNYFGLQNVCHAFFPLLNEGGRVVNVSSLASQYATRKLSKELKEKFLAKDLTETQLDALCNKFIKDVTDGTWEKEGFPKSAYGMSKVGVTQLTRVQANANKIKNVLINSCCPGYVKTDMSSNKGSLTPAEGAETPVFLAVDLKDSDVSGAFWSLKKQASFE